MRDKGIIRRFCLRFLPVFLLLVLPWSGIERVYRSAFLAFLDGALCGVSARREVTREPLARSDRSLDDARLVIVNRALMAPDGSGPVRHLDFSTRSVGWFPTALFVALMIATPMTWRRRAWASLCGIALLHFYIAVVLKFAMWNESTAVSLVTLSPSGKELATQVQSVLLNYVSMPVPLLLWLLLGVRGPLVPTSSGGKRRARDLVPQCACGLLPLLFCSCDEGAQAQQASAATPPPPASTSAPQPPAFQLPPPAPLPEADLSAAFDIPPDWQSKPNYYRSPLVFEDGTKVESAADWQRRREEIRKRWDDILGPWPELLPEPAAQVLETFEEEGIVCQRVRIELAPHHPEEGLLLFPKGAEKCPAVLVLTPYGTSELMTCKPFTEVAAELARRGYVTLTLGPPGGNPRRPEMLDAPCQPLSYLAYLAANAANFLASRPEVDPHKIGVTGHSYGGKWALFASCLYDKFACAVWSEAGVLFDEGKGNAAYNSPWYLAKPKPRRETRERDVPLTRGDKRPSFSAYRDLRDRNMDLHELHALMAPRPFLVSAGSNRLPSSMATCADDESRWLALRHTIEVNRLLGFERRVAMTNRVRPEQDPLSIAQAIAFFNQFLR